MVATKTLNLILVFNITELFCILFQSKHKKLFISEVHIPNRTAKLYLHDQINEKITNIIVSQVLVC